MKSVGKKASFFNTVYFIRKLDRTIFYFSSSACFYFTLTFSNDAHALLNEKSLVVKEIS